MNDSTFQENFQRLNSAQKQAVTEIEGPVMVVAGPGTGKTQVLTMRIAEILKRTQTNPWNILALTFTESGVVAMRDRLRDIIGPASYYVDIYTFHSFCNDIIKKWPDKFMFAKDLEPITEIEQIQTMREIIDKLELENLRPFNSRYFYSRPSLKAISDLKREGVTPEELTALIKKDEEILAEETEVNPRTGKIYGKYQDREKQIAKQKELAQIYAEYQKSLQKKGRYDFEDMIMFVTRKFREDDFLLAYYQEKYQYFLIDEYQDTNASQNSVVELLGSFFDSPNTFIVGDDDQAIYRFQGASLENILDFNKKYGDAKKVVLKENYRSGQKILDAARNLIINNKERLEIEKELHAQFDTEGVAVAELETGNEEAYFIARKIQELQKEGQDLSEIAVFYRKNSDALDISTFLDKLEIPYETSNGSDILEDIQVQKILALLNLIEDPLDDKNFFRVLNLDFLNIDPEDVYRITRYVRRKRKSQFYDIIRDPSALKDAELKNIVKIYNLSVLLDQWTSYKSNLIFAEFFEKILHESGFMQYLLDRDNLDELNSIKTLFDLVKNLNRGDHSLKLENLLEMLSVMEENYVKIEKESSFSGKSAVKLMTAHKAKGLEFDTVFIFKAVDKVWGNSRKSDPLKLPAGIVKNQNLTDHDENEDERRLFYVALTRAKKRAFITYAKTYNNFAGKPKPQSPTIFLSDIGELPEIDTAPYSEDAKLRLHLLFRKPKQQELSSSLKDYLKELVKDYSLSVTGLNTYLACPKKFFYQNIIRVPRTKDKTLAFGSAVHYGLQQLFERYRKEGVLPKEEFLMEGFRKGLEREVLTKEDHESALQKGAKILNEYYQHYCSIWQKPLHNEFSFLSHKVVLDDIPLTGQIDRIDMLDPQISTVNVVDYKTGRPRSENEVRGLTENSDGNLMRQIVFYKLLGDLDPWFKYKVVTGELDFIEGLKKVQIEILSADVEGLKGEIREAYGAIQDLKFDKIEKGKDCERCDFCKVCWG
ncbi:MAG: UvrD-helicase domain-containing protein [Patescibacteria group bacterium]|nr:UvrD-helicase domain-containing protein [Patescibacteria group bacterium]